MLMTFADALTVIFVLLFFGFVLFLEWSLFKRQHERQRKERELFLDELSAIVFQLSQISMAIALKRDSKSDT